MFVYSCTSEVQWVTKLNLSFKKLSIQFIQDLDFFIFLSNFSKNIKEFHLQIVTFGIFYSQSACTSCVLPISTWQICLPMLDAHDNLFKSVSLSVCYHHSGHRSLPVFPYFLLSLWFLAHVNWSNFQYLYIFLLTQLSRHPFNSLIHFGNFKNQLNLSSKFNYTCFYYKEFVFIIPYENRQFNLHCCIFF